MVRAVCFDLDGTLGGYAGDFQGLIALLRSELMLHACDMNSFSELVKQELARDGALTFHDVMAKVLERLTQKAPRDLAELAREAVAVYASEVRPAPGAAELLARLSGAGIGLALLSNGPVDMQRAALHALGFERHFKVVLISGDPDVAARKPSPRIFSLACAGLMSSPGETLMIGDNLLADVKGALDYGMQAVLIGSDRDGLDAGVPAVGGLLPLDTLLTTRYGL